MPISWAHEACNAVIHIASGHVVGVKIFAIFLALPRFPVISLIRHSETAVRQTIDSRETSGVN